MKKKPLISEFHSETSEREKKKFRTSVILEADAFYLAKEMALKRKRDGVEPSTLTGILSEALREFIKKEKNT